MGVLTDDMTRLRGEIDTLRGAREGFCEALVRGAKDLCNRVSRMQAESRKAHADMAERAGADRAALRRDVQHAASEARRAATDMTANFRNARAEMARETGEGRSGFVNNLRRSVSKMTTGFNDALSQMSIEMKGSTSASLDATRNAVSALRRTVADLRRDFDTDICGARAVFSGRTTSRSKPKAETKPRDQEAESPGRVKSPQVSGRRGKAKKAPSKTG